MEHVEKEPELKGMIISDTSIKQPVFITMLMLLAVVIGGLAYSTLPVNLLPDFAIPVVAVTITYPGVGPETMAEQIAKPIEDQLITLSGVQHVSSTSRDSFTVFIIEYDFDTPIDQAMSDVRDKVNAVVPSLPRDVLDPVFLKFDPNQSPIMQLVISSSTERTPLELRKLVDSEVIPRLQQAPGVGSVSVSGGNVRQINVQMALDKLKSYSILPVQITRAIQSANADRGLGVITVEGQDVSLHAPSMLVTPDDIARVQITGTRYRVGDVAWIEDSTAEVEQYARLNGQDAIVLGIVRQSGTNIVEVADGIYAQLDQIFRDNPDLQYTVASDQSEDVRVSVRSAIEELIVAGIAAMLVVFLFFRDIRNTVVTILGLPIIMIATFAALALFNISINLLSLLALSVSVGLVIDDAIVVRENIFRQMQRGISPKVAASRGTAQVSLSVLAMSLTVIAVFLPVAFSGGISGIFFKAFGITVASAMAISLVEALTLGPMLSAHWFKRKEGQQDYDDRELTPEEDVIEEANEPLSGVARAYESILAWTLKRRWLVMLVTIVVFALSLVAAGGLKFAFFPTSEEPELAVGFELAPGSPLEKTNEIALELEKRVLADPDVESVLATVGGSGTAEQASFSVKLHKGAHSEAVVARLRQELAFVPNVAFGRPTVDGTASASLEGRDIQMRVLSVDPIPSILPFLAQLQAGAQQYEYLTDIDTSYKPGRPEVAFKLDPTKIGDLGFTNDDIATSVRALINGETATKFREAGEEYDVVVRLAPSDRVGIGAIQSISVPTANGNLPLSAIAEVELRSSSTVIRRYDRMNEVLIGANVEGRNVTEVQLELAAAIDQMEKPAGVSVVFGGTAQMQAEGFTTLYIAMGLSVIFVYMVLASQFGSFLQPFVIMLAMPFSFIGAFLALRLTNIELSIFGMIGLIMLLGLVVKNSILMVDFTNNLRRAGLEKDFAIHRAAAIRLRPILMTTFALIAGSLPAAIGLGEGAELRRALSVVVIGGLLTSMFLTLLVVPSAYSLLDSFTTGFGRLWKRKPAPSAQQRSALASGIVAQAPHEATSAEPATSNGAEVDQEQHAEAVDQPKSKT
jgi:HAE1 family hydrophobic/amphiphilic exporter-1